MQSLDAFQFRIEFAMKSKLNTEVFVFFCENKSFLTKTFECTQFCIEMKLPFRME